MIKKKKKKTKYISNYFIKTNHYKVLYSVFYLKSFKYCTKMNQVLQYFSNVRYNLAAPDVFADVIIIIMLCLTLSRHSSLSFITGPQGYIPCLQSCCM